MRLAYLASVLVVGLLVQEPAAAAAPARPVQADSTAAPRPDSPTRIEVYRILFDTFPIPDSHTDPVAPPVGRRNLEFRFGVDGAQPADSVEVTFRMDGLDADWMPAGNRRVAYYRDLAPGRYTFRVRARGANGRWTSSDAVPIYIEPHFYETWWFAALVLVGLVALVGGLFRYQRLQTRRMAQLVDERTEALRTERDRAERALDEARYERATSEEALGTVEKQAAQLLEMDQMKSRLFANLSHEFRTPLTLILDPLERAVKGELGELDGYTTHALDLARLNATRLLRLINQLLDLAKLEAGGVDLRARELDLVRLLQEATDLFATEADRLGVTLLFRTDDTQRPVYADLEKVEKIVFNLISNALKATPHGGKVLVTLRAAEPHAAGDGDPAAQGYAEITVRDTGVGIPKQDLAHIFDRFYQTDTGLLRGGTGIGLSLVKELVDLHQGEIEVESEPGFGSVFSVRLPLGTAHLSDEELEGPPDAPRTGRAAEREPPLPLVADSSPADGTRSNAAPEPPAPTPAPSS